MINYILTIHFTVRQEGKKVEQTAGNTNKEHSL